SDYHATVHVRSIASAAPYQTRHNRVYSAPRTPASRLWRDHRVHALQTPPPAGADPPRPALTVAAGFCGKNHSQSVRRARSEEHTSELQSRENLVCRLLLEKKKEMNKK